MADFIELGQFDPLDPYEKVTSKKLFKVSLITNPDWDDQGHIWFDYEGSHVTVKGDVKEFEKALTK